MVFSERLFIHADPTQRQRPLARLATAHRSLHNAEHLVPGQMQELAGATGRGALLSTPMIQRSINNVKQERGSAQGTAICTTP